MKRTLSLHRETLAELAAGELAAVHGGTNTQKVCLQVTQLCPSFGCTGYYPSIFDPCTQ